MDSRLKESRVIEFVSAKHNLADPVITIFVGLFNAEPYLNSIMTFLAAQHESYQILIVDNNSSDSTWSKLHEWPLALLERVTLVKNPINLGATGSLLLNLDLVRAPWVSTIHQDDYYLQNHVDVLVEGIYSASANCACIVTDMGSLSSTGKIEAGRPRASWILPDDTPETMFVANLRLHTAPFPAAAFRVDKLWDHQVPWHSTAMPDTEWVLKSLGQNEIMHVPKITMHYRENPLSESHSIGESETQLGNFMAINRVVSSESFSILLRSVEISDRSKFAKSVLKGFSYRIVDESHLKLLALSAAEQMALAWGYSEPTSLSIIRQAYANAGSDRIESLVDGIADFYGVPINTSSKTGGGRSETSNVTDHQNPSRWRTIAANFTVLWLHLLPYGLRRKAFKQINRVSNKLTNGSPWDFDWR